MRIGQPGQVLFIGELKKYQVAEVFYIQTNFWEPLTLTYRGNTVEINQNSFSKQFTLFANSHTSLGIHVTLTKI